MLEAGNLVGLDMGNKKTELEAFLDEPNHSHAREAILMSKLSYYLKLAAARRGYYLNSYFDDVDRDGFDVIFDDQDSLRKIQVKSVSASASTASWEIHKKILRPGWYLGEQLGFGGSPAGEGSEGGVILMRFKDVNGKLEVEYSYTDVFVLSAFHCGVISRKHPASRKAVDKCIAEARRGIGTERVDAPIAGFIKAKGPDELLSLMGLHANSSFAWKEHLLLVFSHHFRIPTRALPMSLDRMWDLLTEEILELTDDSSLEKGRFVKDGAP